MDEYDTHELLKEILEWGDKVPEFDDTFVRSVEEWASTHDITMAQVEALENIALKWNVPCSFNRRTKKPIVEAYQDKIDMILKWASTKPNFKTDFVVSIGKNIEQYGKITDKQKGAIDNVIAKWKIGR